MDSKELFTCCRRGDLPRLQYLLEQREAEVNVRDKWDSTPLYYACLCGHEEVVKYLLDNGSRCEANTFDGERCLYAAHNDNIKKTLIKYKQVSAHVMRRDSFSEFLRRMLERGIYSDVTFVIHGCSIQAHRCVLSARCQYFAEMFRGKWRDRATITLTNKFVQPIAFKALLQYLYTARLETHLDHIGDVFRLARHCNLTRLIDDIELKLKTVLTFEMSKPGVNVTMLCVEPTSQDRSLQQDFCQLADLALPVSFCSEVPIAELPFPSQEVQLFGDVYFSVNQYKFLCHQLFFCERSGFFKALQEDHFGESSMEGNLPVLHIKGITPEVFAQVLFYMYQDSCEQLTADNVFDVLAAADMFMLPGLKRQCANVISQYLEVENVVNVLRSARLYDLPRLEDQCAEFMASNIEKMSVISEFLQIVSEDASTVQEREEADSIPIIDDIRFHITNFVQTYSDMYEADGKMAIIDHLLEELDLEA